MPMRRHPPAAPPPSTGPVETVYGLRASLAVLTRRPEDIVRVAYGRGVDRDAGELVRWAASRRVPAAEMTDAELERAAGSSHHEGLCVITRPRRWASPKELAVELVR